MPRRARNSEDLLIEPRVLTRRQAGRWLNCGLTYLDLIPETELPRVHYGRAVRFTIKALEQYLLKNSTGGKYR
jgi:hypothetical protein